MKPCSDSAGLAFLTVVEDAVQGVYGGLLLLHPTGRPLELHCSVPQRVNRAQEILYGQSLRGELYGQTIGLALTQALTTPPCLLATDCLDVLALRRSVAFPVVFVTEDASGLGPCEGSRCISAPGFSDDQARVASIWQQQTPTIDLLEPFQRLHLALQEMTQSASHATNQAA